MRIVEIADLDSVDVETSIRDDAEFILKHCGSYVQLYKQEGKPLLRGMSSREHQNRKIFLNTSQASRYPTGSSIESQTKFDEYLREIGVKALRSNSTFVTTRQSFAAMFGDSTYIIFPFDNVPYAWSWTHDDILMIDIGPHSKFREKNRLESLDIFKKEFKILTTDIATAMELGHEIWFSGKYVAVNRVYARGIFELLGLDYAS